MRKMLVLLLVSTATLGLSQDRKAADKAKSIFEAWNSHDPEKVAAMYSDDVVYEDVPFGEAARGHDAMRKFATDFFASVPDVKIEVVNSFVENGRGHLEWVFSGTDKGLFNSGKLFSIHGASIFEMRGDKIVHNKDYYDTASIMKQVGALKNGPGQ